MEAKGALPQELHLQADENEPEIEKNRLTAYQEPALRTGCRITGFRANWRRP